MKDVLQAYRDVDYPLPEKIMEWRLYGAGMENLGKDGKPEEVPMPEFGSDELLARVDAIGICLSDIKVINQGNQHARITGRDMVKDPVVLGHEAALTIVGVGADLKDKFKVGQRFLVQADVFYKGKSVAFGYVLAGAQTQYQVLTKELLDGDEGCYLLPMKETTGYSEAAIAEPWACTVAAYRIKPRASIKPGGLMWIIGASKASDYKLDVEITSGTVVATGLSGSVLESLKSVPKLVETPALGSFDAAALLGEYGNVDDVIVLGADPDAVEQAAAVLGKGGVMCVVSPEPLSRPVKVDIGKIHYWNHAFIGASCKLSDAYVPVRTPSELRPGGFAWFIGAGGPLGQMHVQKAADLKNGPSKILATDIDTVRLNSLKERMGPLAEKRGADLMVVNPNEISQEEFNRILTEFTGGRGFDDIVTMAPVAALITHAVGYLAEEGLLNIFAGLPVGTVAELDLSGTYLCRQRMVGSSGSRLTDLEDTLHAAESGQLATDSSVAAIGGIEASWDGMVATKTGKFPGRVVIYPHVRGLELTGLQELKDRLPNVFAKLTDGVFWNREAEKELIRTCVRNN